jgi:RimJ/RimL family protein N-acetyltransferase
MIVDVVGIDVDAAQAAHLRWLKDPWITRYLECRWNRITADDVARCWQTWTDDPDIIARWIICEGKPVGTIKARVDRHNWNAEVGYMIGERWAMGRGLATDYLRLMVSQLLPRDVRYVHAGVHASNLASQRVLEKAGFELFGTEPGRLIGPCGVEDCLIYGYESRKHHRKVKP